jgi:hypothetical protein
MLLLNPVFRVSRVVGGPPTCDHTTPTTATCFFTATCFLKKRAIRKKNLPGFTNNSGVFFANEGRGPGLNIVVEPMYRPHANINVR